MRIALLFVVAVVVSACCDDEVRFVEDPHELNACSASWAGPYYTGRSCEAACDPRPVLEPVICQTPGFRCDWSVQVDTPSGLVRGCCITDTDDSELPMRFRECE